MKTLTVTGGNLWRIAADQLGDPLQAPRIAVANNLVDYFLPTGTLTTLTIPDALDPSTSTGLPNP